MIAGIELKKFRGYKKLKVSGLERINLILGRNHAGKSSLLESIFLLSGPTNPELAVRLNILRGIDTMRNDPAELWGWLFHEKNMSQSVEITATLVTGKKKSLTIRTSEPTKVKSLSVRRQREARTAFAGSASNLDQPSQIEYTFVNEAGASIRSHATISDSGVIYHRGELKGKVPQTIFMTSRAGYVGENAERYSRLEEVGKETELLPYLVKLEPRMKRLAVLVTGMGPVIHGDIGTGRMIPLHYMGDGIGRLLTMVLSIVSCAKGIVLIDDIDSGLHHSVMKEVWDAVAEAAVAHNVQVFATTHNWECIRAAYDSFHDRKDTELSIQRLERYGEDSEAVLMSVEDLETALLAGIEVR